jgi:hypothetical protein
MTFTEKLLQNAYAERNLVTSSTPQARMIALNARIIELEHIVSVEQKNALKDAREQFGL